LQNGEGCDAKAPTIPPITGGGGMTKLGIRTAALLAAALWLSTIDGARAEEKAAAGKVSLTIVNIEYEGTKIWTPTTIVAHKGDRVALKLVNNVPSDPSQHGFAIPDYKIAEIVDRGQPKTLEFTADRAGIFPIICQLHPAHVAGQLVVLE
jgi:nitrosocyanin